MTSGPFADRAALVSWSANADRHAMGAGEPDKSEERLAGEREREVTMAGKECTEAGGTVDGKWKRVELSIFKVFLGGMAIPRALAESKEAG